MTFEFIGVIFSSTLLAAIIAAIVSKFNNDKNLRVKYVTEERQKWRREIKELVTLIVSNSYENEKELKNI